VASLVRVAGQRLGGQNAQLAIGPPASKTPSEDRIFALTFGYGRFLLNQEVLGHDFGLRVLVNMVGPDQLKTVDARSCEELTLHTRRDVSSESSLTAFEVDVSREVIRSMTGSPENDKLARRMTGADSLALNTRIQPPEIPGLCRELPRSTDRPHTRIGLSSSTTFTG